MSAEEAHEIGRQGVMQVKRYLEGTTYLDMPWTAYDHVAMCRLQKLDNSTKTYDLGGRFLGERRFPIYVEAKKYSSPGGQGAAYDEYLANAYSITARAVRDGIDREVEFMWITWHPFSQSKWTELLREWYVREAVLAHPAVLGDLNGQTPDCVIQDDLCRKVAQRLWLVVLTERQHELVLSPDEVKLAMTVLKREG